MDPSFHNDHYPLCGSIITLSDFLIYCRRTKVIMAARGLWNLNVNMSMLLIFLTVLPWWCHQACFLSTAFRATGDITQLSAQVSRNWPSCDKLVQRRHVMHWSRNFILREDFKAASVWGRQTVVPLPSFSLPVFGAKLARNPGGAVSPIGAGVDKYPRLSHSTRAEC